MTFRLLSAIRSIPIRQSRSIRYFTSELDKAKQENREDDFYLNPDWYRTPQESDGPRCIMPGYPEPPYKSYQARDAYGTFTNQQERRNFGEPVHELYDVLGQDNFDIEQTYSIRYMLTGVGIAAATLFGTVQLIGLFDDKDGWRRNVVDREYPYLHLYHPKNMIGTEKTDSA